MKNTALLVWAKLSIQVEVTVSYPHCE